LTNNVLSGLRIKEEQAVLYYSRWRSRRHRSRASLSSQASRRVARRTFGFEPLEHRCLLAVQPFPLPLQAIDPEGAVAYQGLTTLSIASIGEVQSFTIDLEPGQSMSLIVTPDAALEAQIQVRDPLDASIASVAADSPGQVATTTIAASEAGTYIVDVSGSDDTVGGFTLALFLNASLEEEAFGGDANDTAAQAQLVDIGPMTSIVERGLIVGALATGDGDDDWYSFSLGDSENTTIVLESTAAGPVSVELYRGDGTTLIANGQLEGAARQAIHGFADTTTDATDNEYFLRVSGADAEYQLVVAVGADFDNLSNGSLESAQDITLFGRVLGHVALDRSAIYRVAALAGDELVIATTTPSGEPVMPSDGDMQIEIFDPIGAAIPHANVLGNESLNHTALLNGFYTVRVFSEGEGGDYLLSVDGATGTEAALAVVSANPASGALLSASLSELVLTLSDALDAGSVSAGDLSIDNGQTVVSATGVTVNGNSATFQLPTLADGTYSLSLAAGSVSDLDGQSLAAAFSTTFTLDQTPPELTSASLSQGAVVTSGSPLMLTFQFSEALAEASLDASDVQLVGAASGVHAPTTFHYANQTLTVSYAALAEDNYTLTLNSGALEDLAGNDLAGGDYALAFSVDHQDPVPLELSRLAPLGSLIFAGTTSGLINAASDADRYSFAVQQGDTAAVVALPDDPLAILTIQLEGISESIAADAPGRHVALPPTSMTSTGTIVARVKGDRTTNYTLKVVLNATVEELVTIAQAGGSLGLDPSRVDLGVGSRVAVVGHSNPTALPVGTPTSEPNDTIDTAIFSGIGIASGIDVYTGSGTIGDNPALAPGLDVDMIELQLDVGQNVTIDIDAEGIGSSLDSFLTLFDSSGRIVATNDDAQSADSTIDFTASARDTYYLGVSGFANHHYDPFIAGRGFAGSLGTYEIRIERNLGSGGSPTSTSAVSLPDVDSYSFDLTSLVGRSVDLILKGLNGADFGGDSLQLIGPNGSTVLATAIANPLGLAPTNVDLAILNFVVPTGGTYTARLLSHTIGDYVALLVEKMQFVIEPNDTLSNPLRPLTGEKPTLGFLFGPAGTGSTSPVPPTATSTVHEVESNNTIATANTTPLGFDAGEFTHVSAVGWTTQSDADYFQVALNPGDILAASVTGTLPRVTIFDAAGNELMGSSTNTSFIFPDDSPLKVDGHSLATLVAAEGGDYFVRTSGLTGEYTLNLFVHRPGLERQFVGAKQTIFLDFVGLSGVTLDRAIFGGSGIVTLSPFVDFLPAWGLATSDLNAVIDAVVAAFTENLSADPRARGRNGDFDASGIPGQFDIEILNSRDHANPFGQPNVSRIIIGGTSSQLEVPAIGIAESIDIGNFNTEETAVVMLDLLSGPAGSLNSLNNFVLAPSVTKIDLMGVGLGNVAAHEAAHLLGAYHTDRFNDAPNIIDQGGGLAKFVGLSGSVWGDGDEVDVDLTTDVFSPLENFTGRQDSLNVIAFALSTGTLNAALIGPAVVSVNPTAGLNESAVSEIQIEFSELLAAATATNPANYSLFHLGQNGVFDNGDDDDVLIPVTPTYDGNATVELAIDASFAPLAFGRFQLIIGNEETSIEDLDGNPLNSVSGPGGGSATTHAFEVLAITPGGDVYSFSLAANTRFTFATATPNDDLPNARNSLNPLLAVYDENGNLLAVDHDSRDGKNALLVFRAPATGNYRVRVLAESGTGEYVLEHVNAAQQGDFDRDGSVDASDYVLWRKTLSANVLQSAGADGNGNGLVDDEDFSVWRSNFGQTTVTDGSGSLAPVAAEAAATSARQHVPRCCCGLCLSVAADAAATSVRQGFAEVTTPPLPLAISPSSPSPNPSPAVNIGSHTPASPVPDAPRAVAFTSLRFDDTRRTGFPGLLNKPIKSAPSRDVDETLSRQNLLVAIELLADRAVDRDRTDDLTPWDTSTHSRSKESSNQVSPLDLAWELWERQRVTFRPYHRWAPG
jgi:hypothetical protein